MADLKIYQILQKRILKNKTKVLDTIFSKSTRTDDRNNVTD
ncbi:hypothetical protein SAMN05660477_03096 [Soonwooa buanensis]|uniref:Uncharacterized protein n=1 Tax=Soonwooa buanensis TaxID=619805 RepID=A0A1T5GRQ1_9FLAO|nr:hypothetical protein SAMN05660477_03096 [Soonwooa buanensis]